MQQKQTYRGGPSVGPSLTDHALRPPFYTLQTHVLFVHHDVAPGDGRRRCGRGDRSRPVVVVVAVDRRHPPERRYQRCVGEIRRNQKHKFVKGGETSCQLRLLKGQPRPRQIRRRTRGPSVNVNVRGSRRQDEVGRHDRRAVEHNFVRVVVIVIVIVAIEGHRGDRGPDSVLVRVVRYRVAVIDVIMSAAVDFVVFVVVVADQKEIAVELGDNFVLLLLDALMKKR